MADSDNLGCKISKENIAEAILNRAAQVSELSSEVLQEVSKVLQRYTLSKPTCEEKIPDNSSRSPYFSDIEQKLNIIRINLDNIRTAIRDSDL